MRTHSYRLKINNIVSKLTFIFKMSILDTEYFVLLTEKGLTKSNVVIDKIQIIQIVLPDYRNQT